MVQRRVRPPPLQRLQVQELRLLQELQMRAPSCEKWCDLTQKHHCPKCKCGKYKWWEAAIVAAATAATGASTLAAASTASAAAIAALAAAATAASAATRAVLPDAAR